MRPLLRVVSGGALTTVQDLGRPGAQPLGVPEGGAMDPLALRVANRLAGNPPGAAGLEITLGGFEAEFLAQAGCALAGADLAITADGAPVLPGTAFGARPGAVLRAAGRRRGCRAYLAVHGGLDVPLVLGSRSTYLPAGFGGFGGRALRAGDVLAGSGGVPPAFDPQAAVPEGLVPPCAGPGGTAFLRAVRGPQDEAFPSHDLLTFFDAGYEVSAQADRMGCRLAGPRLGHRAGPDVVSEGIAWGSVQVPGSGEPILLLADRQTVGGYAKIATVAAADLPLAGQLAPGDRVRFREVTVWEAREAWARREVRLRSWEAELLCRPALTSGPRAERATPSCCRNLVLDPGLIGLV